MTRRTQIRRGASLVRWATVGVAAYTGWVLSNLVFVLIFPLLLLIGLLDRRAGYPRLRRFFEGFLRLFFGPYARLVGLHGIAERPERDQVLQFSPCVFVANHRSWLDALLALAYFPGVRVAVKGSYLRAPLLGTAIKWMGCVPFDKSSPASVLEGTRTLREELEAGRSLFVFPETTRAPGEKLLPFSDIFFRVALESSAPVIPVVLHSDVPFLSPGGGSMLTRRRASWTIRVLEPLPRDRRDRASDLGRLARRKLSAQLAQLDAGPGARGGENAKGES